MPSVNEKNVKRPLKGLKPVGKPRSIGDAVYDILKAAILKGDLGPGQRLVEHQLGTQMKTSRIPIREAIKRLEQDGLVEKLDKRGFVVKSVSIEEVEETFGIRAVLESYAAYLATEHIDETTINKLEASIEAYKEALAQGDMEKLTAVNSQFHETIYRAAGSQKLYSLINNFRDFISRYRRLLLTCQPYAEVSLKDHIEMVEAMREKDKDKVENLVKTHISRGKAIIMKEMAEGRVV
jgi:DNA-binding GntR family transcriptional regulator